MPGCHPVRFFVLWNNKLVVWENKKTVRKLFKGDIVRRPTLQQEKFCWNLNFAILLMANSLNLNLPYYISRDLSMIAYII